MFSAPGRGKKELRPPAIPQEDYRAAEIKSIGTCSKNIAHKNKPHNALRKENTRNYSP